MADESDKFNIINKPAIEEQLNMLREYVVLLQQELNLSKEMDIRKEYDQRFYRADDIAKMLYTSKATGYKIIRDLNAELAELGYYSIAGRIPRLYFEKRFGINSDADYKKVVLEGPKTRKR